MFVRNSHKINKIINIDNVIKQLYVRRNPIFFQFERTASYKKKVLINRTLSKNRSFLSSFKDRN